MTKDDTKDRLPEEVNSPNQQQDEQRPFHAVLVDLKEASNNRIHCIEKPLEGTENLKFVAISYRWGELPETTVDTGVGYMATITSFDLLHFFSLCRIITEEIDLQSMEYVWVDAICVNQSNYEERKATIAKMTPIYERANYILAVPDLHLASLCQSNYTNQHVIDGFTKEPNCDYLYYLIQRNIEKLKALDQEWLDEFFVPIDDRQLRLLLTKHTTHFTDALITDDCQDNYFYDYQYIVNHIYETAMKTHSRILMGDGDDNDEEQDIDPLNVGKLHRCNNLKRCPLNSRPTFIDDVDWKYAAPRRSRRIRQDMSFFIDRIIDWSSRTWVVSEYHIAKNKNNKMKYWFLVLSVGLDDGDEGFPTEDKSFFDFDFTENDDGIVIQRPPPDQTFHSVMQNQLGRQTFLEKILKSQATRHEDRFKAILPLSEYKSILDDKFIVDRWANITTMVSVKLELYKWTTAKHKLELLFLSGGFSKDNRPTCQSLPTFATSTIEWPVQWDTEEPAYPTLNEIDDPMSPGNFDLANPSSIQLVPTTTTTVGAYGGVSSLHRRQHQYKLTIRPREYYRKFKKSTALRRHDEDYEEEYENYGVLLQKLLGLNLAPDQHELILIPTLINQSLKDTLTDLYNHGEIMLVGCSTTNHWILTDLPDSLHHPFRYFPCKDESSCEGRGWEVCYYDKNSPGFDIY